MAVTQLGTRQLQQVTQLLQALEEQPPHPSENRRQRVRLRLHLTLAATLLESAALPQVRLFTRNISTTGLGFICQRPFHKDELIAVHLALGQPKDKLLLARVMFCRYVRSAMYESGVEFEDAVPYKVPLLMPRAWVQRANPHAVDELAPAWGRLTVPVGESEARFLP